MVYIYIHIFTYIYEIHMYVVFYISLSPRFLLKMLHMQNIYIKTDVVYILYIYKTICI